jgi:feruloyl esterase
LGDASFAQPNFMNATGNGQNGWRDIGYTGSNAFADVIAAAQARLGALIETADPDLSAFAARGGKLLMWHGTSDSLIPPQGSVRYYEAVAQAAGGFDQAQQFARFYLAPGFDHCFLAGVPGTTPPAPGSDGDPGSGLAEALTKWVEENQEPEELAARSEPGATPVRMRPWCRYPKKLTYVSGDVNTGNFNCE